MTITEALEKLIIDTLSANDKLAALAEASQIRATTDQADPKVTGAAIVVDVTDKGSHLNLPGRVLLDFDVSVAVRTSLTEDEDRSRYNALIQGVEEALDELPRDEEQTGGFTILYAESWKYTGIAVDGFYRYNNLTTSLLVYNNSAANL